jgi:hypothetical protein
MVCGPERVNKKFPFDIQHRTIITYQSDAPGDFASLQQAITDRIRAAITKKTAIRQLVESEQVAPSHGLTPGETLVLAIIAAETALPGTGYSHYRASEDAEKAGLTGIGFAIALRRLLAKKFVVAGTTEDHDGNSFDSIEVTEEAWKWIDNNDSLFVLKRDKKVGRGSKFDDLDDDIPF